MLAMGDLFYLDCDSLFAGWGSLHRGWYIVKGMTHGHFGRIVDLIDMIDGRRCYTLLANLSDVQERYRYSRSEFEGLEIERQNIYLFQRYFELMRVDTQRYFELMGVPERTNWIAEGF